MNSHLESGNDMKRDIHDWMPLDTARHAFTWLVTGPDPLSLDGRDFPGLPKRRMPLDELRDRLLDRRCPRATRDAVWRHLISRARHDGAVWTVACVGMALPGLAGTARWLATRYRGDRADVHAAVLSGFIEALANVDPRDPGVLYRLQWIARRAGQTALEESLDAPLPSVTAFESRAPRTPYGHPDLVLARAVGAGVLTPTEADLISATRLGDESVTGWAHAHGQSVHAVAKARERAEHRLADYLSDAARTHGGPESDDPVAYAALRAIALTEAATGPVADAANPTDQSLAEWPPPQRPLCRAVKAEEIVTLGVEKDPGIRPFGERGGHALIPAPRCQRADFGGAPMRVTPHHPDHPTPHTTEPDGSTGTPREPCAAHQHLLSAAAIPPLDESNARPNGPMTEGGGRATEGNERQRPHRPSAVFLVCATLLLGIAIPVSAHAETVRTLALDASVSALFNNIRTWLMGILAGLATVFLSIGGVRYLMAGGDPGEVEAAKRAFKSAGIGYGLASLAPLGDHPAADRRDLTCPP